jgi:hypothetical protein
MAIPSKEERERRANAIRGFVVASARRNRLARLARPPMVYEVMNPEANEPHYKPGGRLHGKGEYVETQEVVESPDLRED